MSSLTPWMTHSDFNRLLAAVQAMSPDGVMLEYGGGGSTVTLAQQLHGRQQLITIEPSQTWMDDIADNLRRVGAEKYVTLHLIPSHGRGIYTHGRGGGDWTEEISAGAEEYIHADGANIPWERVEVVLVDGVIRGIILALLREKVSPSTRIFLHDYTDREEWYDWAVRLYRVVEKPFGQDDNASNDGHRSVNSLIELAIKI